jgi:glycosyltransferase involved in cell wall biosynthesis
MSGSTPQASVIIPVLNGAQTLAVQLEALVSQVDAPPFEVLVADNGSTDSTRRTAAAFAERLDLRIIDASERRGPSFARNRAADEASSARLLFCDADDRVSSVWVAAMLRALEHDALVTGPVLYADAALVASGAWPEDSSIPVGPRRYLDQVPFAPSNNLAIERDLFVRLGGFDLALRCCEDADLTIRAQSTGPSLGWTKDAVVLNARRSSLPSAAKQFFRYGYYDARLLRKLRGVALEPRGPWRMLRPYVVLALTPYRLLAARRRWSWVINASQRAGRLVGSVRFRVFCP